MLRLTEIEWCFLCLSRKHVKSVVRWVSKKIKVTCNGRLSARTGTRLCWSHCFLHSPFFSLFLIVRLSSSSPTPSLSPHPPSHHTDHHSGHKKHIQHIYSTCKGRKKCFSFPLLESPCSLSLLPNHCFVVCRLFFFLCVSSLP